MHKFCAYLFSLYSLMVLPASVMLAQIPGPPPPVAPVRNVTDEYFGTRVTDPYRYMENLQDTEVQTYMKAQADYTDKVLSKIPGRDEFYNRLKELDATASARIGTVTRTANGMLFYSKILPADNNAKLYMRESAAGKEILLFDPETFEKQTGKTYTISYFFPSPSGKFVACGISASGSEDSSIYILNTKTLRMTDEPISRAFFKLVSWLPDETGFLYNRLQKLGPDMAAIARFKNNKINFHRLGTNPETDTVIFGSGVNPNINITPEDGLLPHISSASPYIFITVGSAVQNEFNLYAAAIESFQKGQPKWQKIVDLSDEVIDFNPHGDDVYLTTHKNAPRYKILKTSIKNPSLQTAETVVGESEAVIQETAIQKDGLYVKFLDGGLARLIRIPFRANAGPEKIPLPFDGSAAFYDNNSNNEGALMSLVSWTHQTGIYYYDPKTKKITDTGLQPQADYKGLENQLAAEEIKVKSYDGTMIPLSIRYKKGIKRDGSNPTLLTGYGAYGSTLTPFFSPTNLAFLEKGFIMATAHVRGGGEYGEAWHQAGMKLNKPNTWKDFIACAEYLIQNKFTSPQKLAVSGGSAGGILAGRAITERPDLFSAAYIVSGVVNPLRFETDANGLRNISELGTVKEADGFKGLYEMDAYHHVKNGVKYPATLFTVGANDPRVPVWESLKFSARLQAVSDGKKPVLLQVEYEGGHSGGSNKEQSFRQLADFFSFLMWQFGETKYQPN